MRHLSEGLLRRVRDDRFAASNDQRAHLERCVRCQQHMTTIERDAAEAARLFAQPVEGGRSVETALVRLRSRVATAVPGGDQAPPTPRYAGRRRWVAGLVTAPLVVVALLVSASAAGWLSIFTPTTVAPITLTAGELTGLPDLSGYGRMQLTRPDVRPVAGPAEAATASGLTVRQPSSLPANIPGPPTWQVVGHGSATFTLDAQAAAGAAASSGRPAPKIPSDLEGTSVTVQAGPAVVAVYGSSAFLSGTDAPAQPPTLLIAQGRRPTAASNGASLKQLENFLVAQPGISPQLAADIRAIGEPGSTLPIPVISGQMSSETITIDNVQGVSVGDATGLGAAVIWEKDGIVYAVGGMLPKSEVLSIALSLH